MADSYSFDVVSDFDRQELVNALDQVRRDVSTRYDLKDSATEVELDDTTITITTASITTLCSMCSRLIGAPTREWPSGAPKQLLGRRCGRSVALLGSST